MEQRHVVRITLTSQLKKCPNGHEVGDEWVVAGKTPGRGRRPAAGVARRRACDAPAMHTVRAGQERRLRWTRSST
jgi:uncharacterized repeat protein (TIGR04076 family)